jgi:hypothetical protein
MRHLNRNRLNRVVLLIIMIVLSVELARRSFGPVSSWAEL